MQSNNPLRRKLKFAIQAEILRSHQRDLAFAEHLKEKLFEILNNFGVHKKWYHLIQLDTPLKLIYFAFTTGMGNQTLGEEYTGIVQANLEELKVPSLTVSFYREVYITFYISVLYYELISFKFR